MVLLTDEHDLYFYDKQNREINTLDSSRKFCSVTTSKNRLLAHDRLSSSLCLLTAPLYGKCSFVSLDRKVLSMAAFEGDTLCYQLRLGQALLITQAASMVSDSIVDVSKKQATVESVKKQLIFEKSYVRMKYKELRSHSKSPSDLSRTFTMNTELAKIARFQQPGSGETSSDAENQRLDLEMNRSDKRIDRFNETGIQELHNRLKSKHSPQASVQLTAERVHNILSPPRHTKTMSMTVKHNIRIEDQRIGLKDKKSPRTEKVAQEYPDSNNRAKIVQQKIYIKNKPKCLPVIECRINCVSVEKSQCTNRSSKRDLERTEYPDQRNCPQGMAGFRLSKQTEDTFQISYTTVSPRFDGFSRQTNENGMRSGESRLKMPKSLADKSDSIPHRGTASLTLLSSPSAFLQSTNKQPANSKVDLTKLHHTSVQMELGGEKESDDKYSNIYESKDSVNIRSLGGSGSKSPDLDIMACKMRFITEFAIQSQLSDKEAELKLKKMMGGQADKMFVEFQRANEIISPNTTIRETLAEDNQDIERSSRRSSIQPILGEVTNQIPAKKSTFESDRGYEIGPDGPLDFKKTSFDSNSRGESLFHNPQQIHPRIPINTESVQLLDPYILLQASFIDQSDQLKACTRPNDIQDTEELIKIQQSKESMASDHDQHYRSVGAISIEKITEDRPYSSFVGRLTISPSRAGKDELNITREIDPKELVRVIPTDMRSEITLSKPLDRLKKLCNQDRARSRGRQVSERSRSKGKVEKNKKAVDLNTSKDRSVDKSGRDSISIYDANSKRSRRILSPNKSGDVGEHRRTITLIQERRKARTGREKSDTFLKDSSFKRRPSTQGSFLGNHLNPELLGYATGLSSLRQVYKERYSKYCSHLMTNLKLNAENLKKRDHRVAYFAREFNLIFNRIQKERLRHFIKIISISESKLTALKNIKAVLGLKSDLKKLKDQIVVEGRTLINDNRSLNKSLTEPTYQSRAIKANLRPTSGLKSPPRMVLPPKPKSASRSGSRPGSRPGSATKRFNNSSKIAEAEKSTGLKFYGWKHLGVPKMYQRGAFKIKIAS